MVGVTYFPAATEGRDGLCRAEQQQEGVSKQWQVGLPHRKLVIRVLGVSTDGRHRSHFVIPLIGISSFIPTYPPRPLTRSTLNFNIFFLRSTHTPRLPASTSPSAPSLSAIAAAD
ncbi:hypothetical protein E2C01_054993 [Portunus trituberculatus]|uniref:Uncharacterized protein n=1 Tax=Portunus trituberculatus TaxID=210409 RepID=A0A5B7GTI3_PORTR|nr:hypothetical protein [Portunus trituberculatus]